MNKSSEISTFASISRYWTISADIFAIGFQLAYPESGQ